MLIMANDWVETTLGEILTLQRGFDLPETERDGGSCPVIASTGQVGSHSVAMVRGPGVVIGRSGSLGGGQFIRSDFWPLNTTLWVKDFKGNDVRFCYYLLKSLDLATFNAGSGVPTLNRNHIHPLPVRAPRMVQEQRAIAHVLGALDDKIELHRRMNDTLEAVAQTIFKSWRATFDAIRVKISDLVRDGVLEIGDGYRAKNSELRAPGLPFIRAGDLNDGFDTADADVLCQDSVRKAGAKVSRVGDVAFTSKGTIGRFARVTEHTAKFVYSPQVCFWRSLDPGKLEPAVLYLWMQSDELRAQIEAVAGQTDMAPYVSLRDQRLMEMPLFPKSQHGIAEQLDPILARQALLAEEIEALGGLRDALLPKLISGELRVSDAERLVEAAV